MKEIRRAEVKMTERKIDEDEADEFRRAMEELTPGEGNGTGVSDSEAALFRDMVGSVRPIENRQHRPARPAPKPNAAQRHADEKNVLDELLSHEIDPATVETGEEIFFLRDGVQHRVLRQLRRGRYSVEACLDLHEMNAQAAEISIREFLADSQYLGKRCIKVIHGKGLRSKSRGPVLKNLTNTLLRRHKAVLAFASAPSHDGGTGAVHVLLRKR